MEERFLLSCRNTRSEALFPAKANIFSKIHVAQLEFLKPVLRQNLSSPTSRLSEHNQKWWVLLENGTFIWFTCNLSQQKVRWKIFQQSNYFLINSRLQFPQKVISLILFGENFYDAITECDRCLLCHLSIRASVNRLINLIY